ncbi:hypothetical protein TNCV_2595491 [Trichonephila clavipes]|nr:hypothetical protein TNCV_2595491 [Trichonephila clavipes]
MVEPFAVGCTKIEMHSLKTCDAARLNLSVLWNLGAESCCCMPSMSGDSRLEKHQPIGIDSRDPSRV